jgi:hypothetical protein
MKNSKEKIYKLRAECLIDVEQFVANNIKVKDICPLISSDFPDRELEFISSLSKKEIIKILNKIPDSHVMIETLEKIEKYTGKRR